MIFLVCLVGSVMGYVTSACNQSVGNVERGFLSLSPSHFFYTLLPFCDEYLACSHCTYQVDLS